MPRSLRQRARGAGGRGRALGGPGGRHRVPHGHETGLRYVQPALFRVLRRSAAMPHHGGGHGVAHPDRHRAEVHRGGRFPMKPLNFHKWIDEHRDLLKPPVGNAQIWEGDRDFMVTVVGGPNARTDYHINQGEEFFYQVEGDIVLRTLQDGKRVDVPIRQGEIFLLPSGTPHSPQRPANTVGLVIERRRLPEEKDTFLWVCDGCGSELYRESFHLTDIVKQLPPVFEHYWGNPANTTCRKCSRKHAKP